MTEETEGQRFARLYPNHQEKEKKEAKSNYLSPQRVLPKTDYQKYKEAKKQSQKYKYLNKLEKLQKENRVNSRRESYLASRTGRFSRRIERGYRAARSPTRALYEREGRRYIPPSPQRKLQLQQMRQAAMQKIQEQQHYNWVFSDFRHTGTDKILEGEIMGKNGYGNEGNREASFVDAVAMGSYNNYFYGVNQEALRHSHTQHIIPLMKTSINAKRHSQTIITDPFMSVNKQVDIFSNIIP